MDQANEVRHETVLDTGAEQLGSTYAKALIGAAQSAGAADEVIGQLNELTDALRDNPSLQQAFASPRIDADEKSRVIDRLLGGTSHPTLVNFLKVMARRERLGYVPAVAAAAEELHDEMMGRVVAMVRTAVPLDDDLREQVRQRLCEQLQADVRLRESVDPDLIGGMVVRVGDRVYDSSVANRMKQMKKRVQAGFASKLMERFEQFTS